MYKCNNCGKIVEKLKEVEPTYQECGYVEDYCSCGGQYVDAYQCKECGEWFTEEELDGGICEECIDSSINLQTVFEYVNECDLEDDIHDCLKSYVNQDRQHFGEWLANRGAKGTKTMLIDDLVNMIVVENRDFLAKKSKVPYSTIGNWVQGKAIPNLLNAEAVINAMGYELKLVKRSEKDSVDLH
jgi:hypothetical protein